LARGTVLIRTPLLGIALVVLTAQAITAAPAKNALTDSGAVAVAPTVAVETLWDQQKRTFGAVAIVVAVETALLVGLVRLGNRRREAQRLLEARLRFERRLSHLSVTLATVPGEELDAALEHALKTIGDDVGADAVWRWTFASDGDEWESPGLRAGQQAAFTNTAELPQAVQARASAGRPAACSCLATPLVTTGTVSDVLFWFSYGTHTSWAGQADKLRVVSAVVATVLQGRASEAALERSDRLKGAILDSLPSHVAVLDRDGVIVTVNDVWVEFGAADGAAFGAPVAPGTNYPDICAAAARAGAPGAARALSIIKRACRGERSLRQIEFRSELSGRARWFAMTAEPLRHPEGGAVVVHVDITERKLGELALRESESRTRRAERRLRDVNRRLLAAQEDERRRIARELHDHLSQQLALLAIDLQELTRNPPATTQELTAALHEEWRRTTEIASDVHAISHRLHPSKLETLGLVTTLRAHCRDLSRKSLTTHFSEQDLASNISAEISLCLFRVAEEALSNVARHSSAPEAFVTLFGTGADVVLRIVDSGCGFDRGATRSHGIGLVSMRERVEALGGTFSISSMPGSGTVVEARVRLAVAPVGPTALPRAESA
jgi:signal transduction histidine kinase